MSTLPRTLTVFDGAALLVGSVIGSGIFVVPKLIAQRVPEPGLVIAIWVFSGLLVVCGALTLAELGAMLPESGGLYVYMREAYGPFFAFLYGWTTMLVVISGSLAALTTAFLLYVTHFIPMALWVQKIVGIAAVAGLAFVNSRGVKHGAAVQNVFTVLKLAGLAALVVLALVTRRGDVSNFAPLLPDHFSFGMLSAAGLAMISTLFAYDGWHFVGLVAGEMRDPGRNVARSIILGVVIVIVAYVSANLAYIFVLGQPRIVTADRVATDAMTAMVGSAGGTFMTLAILCSIFGAMAANVLAGPRIFFAMARDGRLFPSLAAVHPKYQTPANAIWALSLWGGVLTLTGGFEHLITMATFANFIFFTMIVFSVVVLRRKRPDLERPYRVPAYPLPVIVFVLVSVCFVVNTLVEEPVSSLMGLGLVLVGVPFYFRRTPAAK